MGVAEPPVAFHEYRSRFTSRGLLASPLEGDSALRPLPPRVLILRAAPHRLKSARRRQRFHRASGHTQERSDLPHLVYIVCLHSSSAEGFVSLYPGQTTTRAKGRWGERRFGPRHEAESADMRSRWNRMKEWNDVTVRGWSAGKLGRLRERKGGGKDAYRSLSARVAANPFSLATLRSRPLAAAPGLSSLPSCWASLIVPYTSSSSAQPRARSHSR